jgi:hypothetical protein
MLDNDIKENIYLSFAWIIGAFIDTFKLFIKKSAYTNIPIQLTDSLNIGTTIYIVKINAFF